ncbi:MAG: DUF2508 family protein [Clostridia bacterium]|nr:DUF2508 family protein [Clostridia bacterium]
MQSLKQRRQSKLTAQEKQQEHQRLLGEYYDTLIQLRQVRAAFQQVTDPDLINACVYEMNALQRRYSYLLQRVKEERLTAMRVLK